MTDHDFETMLERVVRRIVREELIRRDTPAADLDESTNYAAKLIARQLARRRSR